MPNIKQDLENLVSTLKRRTGYHEENEPGCTKIIAVNLQSQNGAYFVTVHYDTNQEITKLFENGEVIHAITDFLKCEEYIGHPVDKFKADFVCKGSIRY